MSHFDFGGHIKYTQAMDAMELLRQYATCDSEAAFEATFKTTERLTYLTIIVSYAWEACEGEG